MANTKTLNTRIQIKHDTCANWAKATDFVGLPGEIIVYDDRYTYEVDGKTINIPGIKVCDGNAYAVDLPFIDLSIETRLSNHINDTTVHITAAERTAWNNKMNADEIYDADNEIITLTK